MSEEPSLLNFVTNVVALAYQAPGDDRREVLGRALDQFTGGRYDIRFRGANEGGNSANGESTASPPAASPDNKDSGEQIDAVGDGAEQIVGIARAESAAGEEEAPSASSGAKSSVGDDDDDYEALFSDDSDALSYKSCDSSVASAERLYDNNDTERFPNGTLCYTVGSKDFDPSWIAARYSHKGSKDYYSCLGMYECNVDGCRFRANPIAPRKKKYKHCAPSHPAGKKYECSTHHRPLVHRPCRATYELVRTETSTEVVHKGTHAHQRPQENKVPKAALAWVRKQVRDDPNVKPNELVRGTEDRKPARDVHKSLNNLDRVKHVTKQFEKKKPESQDLKKFVKKMETQEDHLGMKFLQLTDITRGRQAIIMQFPGMAEVVADNREYAYQSDSIEGWIKDDDYPEMIVTISSTHSKILGRHVPVVMSITFGRTKEHYSRHFELLFANINASSLEEFQKEFPGNISDFSDGLREGFEIALRKKYNVPKSAPRIDVVGLYQFCHTHFKSSAGRVAKSHSLVPKARQEQFWAYINRLLSDKTTEEEYHSTIESIKKKFRNLKDWIDWYNDEKRRKHIFPAMGGSTIRGHGKNTNGQEGTGGWIKRSFRGKPQLVRCAHHLYLEGLRVENDLLEEKVGNRTRYGKKTEPKERVEQNQKTRRKRRANRKQATQSDSRPPDNEKQLIRDKKGKGSTKGRPRGAKGNTPSAANAVNPFHAIPWSYEFDGIDVTNTCPLDSFLMLLYLMRRMNTMTQDRFHLDEKVTEVLNMIDAGEGNPQMYDRARHTWMYHLIGLNGVGELRLEPGSWDLFSDSCVHSAVSKLFQMKVQYVYESCSDKGDRCEHHDAYSGAPGLLASQELEVTILEIDYSNYKGLQDYFDKEHNNFGKLVQDNKSKGPNKTKKWKGIQCGSEIDLCPYNRLTGCEKGRRGKRLVITAPPQILELYLLGLVSERITKPSEFEHLLEINDREYTLVGALLNNGGVHYRSLAVVGGKYLEYDGMRRKNKLMWHAEGKTFTSGMYACKLWYKLVDDTETTNVAIPSGATLGYPDGVSIGPKKHVRLVADKCASCDGEIMKHHPCLVVKENEEGNDGMTKVSLYHLMKSCEGVKCTGGFADQADEIEEAIANSSYPEKEKARILNWFSPEAVTLDDENGEGEGGDKGDKSNGEDSKSDESSDEETVAVGSKGFCFQKYFDNGWHTGRVCALRWGAEGDKNRRVVYPDGDGEDLTLQQVRRLDEKARKAGKFVEEGWFDKEYSLRVGDVIECDDYAEPIEIFKDLPVGGKVVSIEVEDRAANKWKIVTDGKCHLTSEDDEIDVVSSEYHWVDAPKKGLRVKIRDLNLIPGKAAGWGGLEKLAGAAEDTAMTGKETRRSKRKQEKESKDGEGGEQKKKSKKQK